jgi:hypothetical protein
MIGTAARLIDAADRPFATEDGVVRAVLVDPRAETSGAHGERHLGASPGGLAIHLADRNKCLARNNKSSDGREATNVSNGSNVIMTDDWKGNHRGFQDHKKKKPQQQQQVTQKDWDKIDAILGNDQIRSRLFDAGYVIVRR